MKRHPCIICLERPAPSLLCGPCGVSYDRDAASDTTTWACIKWAAKRSRRFERLRVKKMLQGWRGP